MSEDTLTNILVQNLKKGGINKLVKIRNSEKMDMNREIGNSSYVADIFISLYRDNDIKKFNSKEVKFIAIEVKIKDWKQGLYQAWRYNSFAEKSYLAIYEKYTKNIDINLFKEYNVGLIVFNENKIKVLNKPRGNKFSMSSNSLKLRENLWSRLPIIKTI